MSLAGNRISDVSFLEWLPGLTRLGLGNNNIADIEPLGSLVNLSELGLSHNAITDISPLASLPNVAWLWLQENNIADIGALVVNGSIIEGHSVDLRDNPLDTRSTEVFLPQLQKRKVTIEWKTPARDVRALSFGDINLELALRAAINKPSGDIYPDDLTRLDSPQCAAEKIKSLGGLENCTGAGDAQSGRK